MFVPFSSLADLIALADRSFERRIRQAEMLLTLLHFEKPKDLPNHGYLDTLEAILVRRKEEQARTILRSTYFGMWLEALGLWFQSGQSSGAILPPPLDLDALGRLARQRTLREEDVPPLMRQLIPPSHSFRRHYEPYHSTEIGEKSWERALEVAIENSDRMMPGLRQLIEAFTNHFLILENVAFRSCSADRYLGLILLSTTDQSLIDIEESIVHEVGHQILYQLDRDRQLLHSHDDDFDVELPWSGSHRNYFGFFHASYIYLILRDYYALALRKHPFDRPYCSERFEIIQQGLERAVFYLREGSDYLTPFGLNLLSEMIAHIEKPRIHPTAKVAHTEPFGAAL